MTKQTTSKNPPFVPIPPLAFLGEHKLSPSEGWILATICSFMKNGRFICHVKRETIAERAGIYRNNLALLDNAIRRLEEAGLLKVDRMKNRSHYYHALFDPDPWKKIKNKQRPELEDKEEKIENPAAKAKLKAKKPLPKKSPQKKGNIKKNVDEFPLPNGIMSEDAILRCWEDTYGGFFGRDYNHPTNAGKIQREKDAVTHLQTAYTASEIPEVFKFLWTELYERDSRFMGKDIDLAIFSTGFAPIICGTFRDHSKMDANPIREYRDPDRLRKFEKDAKGKYIPIKPNTGSIIRIGGRVVNMEAQSCCV